MTHGLSLFDTVPDIGARLDVSEVRRVERWGHAELAWTCPHCGGELEGGRGETPETAAADPACALCRAEYRGMAFRDWRRIPLATRMADRPPAGWRSARRRS